MKLRVLATAAVIGLAVALAACQKKAETNTGDAATATESNMTTTTAPASDKPDGAQADPGMPTNKQP